MKYLIPLLFLYCTINFLFPFYLSLGILFLIGYPIIIKYKSDLKNLINIILYK